MIFYYFFVLIVHFIYFYDIDLINIFLMLQKYHINHTKK